MPQPALQLGRTLEVFTTKGNFAFPLSDRLATDGALRRHPEGAFLARPRRYVHPDHFRNDFTRLLDIDLVAYADILALDRIQKRMPVDDTMIRHLRRAGLVEGHKPNLHVSAALAKSTDDKANYIRTRAQDDMFYSKLVLDYLEKFGQATRKEIDGLLLDKLSDGLNSKQKVNKISNLLTKMRRSGLIVNAGTDKSPSWVFAEQKK